MKKCIILAFLLTACSQTNHRMDQVDARLYCLTEMQKFNDSKLFIEEASPACGYKPNKECLINWLNAWELKCINKKLYGIR